MAHGVSQPVWSPDGNRLAFVSRTGECNKSRGPAVPWSGPFSFGRNRALFTYDGVGWFDSRRSHVFVVAHEGERRSGSPTETGTTPTRHGRLKVTGSLLSLTGHRAV